MVEDLVKQVLAGGGQPNGQGSYTTQPLPGAPAAGFAAPVAGATAAPAGSFPVSQLLAQQGGPTYLSPGGRQRSYSPGDIYSGFAQSAGENCVSVAWIKAAMARFGPNGIFQNVQKTGNGYNVTMRDGAQVQLTNQEVEMARQAANFKGTDPQMMEQATIAFAAMAKRAQMEGNDGVQGMSYQQALQSLNNGENTNEGAHWLGIDQHVRVVSAADVNKHPYGIASSNSHAFFTANGINDFYGNQMAANGTDGKGQPVTHGFVLA